jgi:hypothetical protein
MVVLGATHAAGARADVFFKTPSGNIVCQSVAALGELQCSVLSSRRGSALPVYFVGRRGRSYVRTLHGNPAVDVPILGYGKTRRVLGGAVLCTSRKRGLTCRNRSDHGYFLSRGERHRF